MQNSNQESIEAFMARGGKVQEIPTGVSGDRGGRPSLNPEEMAARRRYNQSDVFICVAKENKPRYGSK